MTLYNAGLCRYIHVGADAGEGRGGAATGQPVGPAAHCGSEIIPGRWGPPSRHGGVGPVLTQKPALPGKRQTHHIPDPADGDRVLLREYFYIARSWLASCGR